jgi:hypothetical protein
LQPSAAGYKAVFRKRPSTNKGREKGGEERLRYAAPLFPPPLKTPPCALAQ